MRSHAAFLFFAGGTRPQNTCSETPHASAILCRFPVVGVVSPSSHWATADGLIPILSASTAWVSPLRLSRQRTMRSLNSTPPTKHVLGRKSTTIEDGS